MDTPVFSGTLAECLDLLRKLPRENVPKLVEFTGAHPQTVTGWLLDPTKQPTGEWALRCIGFFLLSGWRVKELAETEELVVDLIKIWSHQILQGKEIANEVGWKHQQPLIEFIFGRREPTTAIRKNLVRVVNDHRGELEQRLTEVESKFAITGEPPQVDTQPSTQNGRPAAALAELLVKALPLLEQLNNDDTAAGEAARAELRRRVSPENYTRLALTLRTMTTETTRAARRTSK